MDVEAELQLFGRDDVALEAAVSRLSLEPSISSVSWSVVEEPGVTIAAEDSPSQRDAGARCTPCLGSHPVGDTKPSASFASLTPHDRRRPNWA